MGRLDRRGVRGRGPLEHTARAAHPALQRVFGRLGMTWCCALGTWVLRPALPIQRRAPETGWPMLGPLPSQAVDSSASRGPVSMPHLSSIINHKHFLIPINNSVLPTSIQQGLRNQTNAYYYCNAQLIQFAMKHGPQILTEVHNGVEHISPLRSSLGSARCPQALLRRQPPRQHTGTRPTRRCFLCIKVHGASALRYL